MEDDDEDAYRERAMALCVRCYSADAAGAGAATGNIYTVINEDDVIIR